MEKNVPVTNQESNLWDRVAELCINENELLSIQPVVHLEEEVLF